MDSLLLRQHWAVILVAILIGVLYASHRIFIAARLGAETYYPFSPAYHSDELAYYGPRVNAVLHGDFRAGDINLSEYTEGPAVLPMLNPILMAGLAQVFGSMKAAFIVSDIIFPPLILLGIYLLAAALTGRKTLALVFATITLLVPRIGSYLPPLSLDWLLGLLNDFARIESPTLLYFARFEYPRLTFIFFIFALYFLHRAIVTDDKKSAIITGVLFGIQFYTYLYDWVYFAIALLCMLVIFYFRGRLDLVRRIVVIGGIGLSISLFYWINLYQLHGLPSYNDVIARVGVEVSHDFRWSVWKSYLRNALLALFVLWTFGKSVFPTATYLVSFLIPLFVVFNLQMITGFNPQPNHWYLVNYWPVNVSLLVLVCWLYEQYGAHRLAVHENVLRSIGFCVIGLLLSANLYGQYRFSMLHADEFILSPEYTAAYDWLNANTPPGSVVGAISYRTNNELTLLSGTKQYIPDGLNTTASDAEIWERFISMNKLVNVTSESFTAMLRDRITPYHLFHGAWRPDFSLDSYLDSKEDQAEQYAELDHLYDDKIAAYAELADLADPRKTPYRLDYILIGPRERALGAKEHPSGLPDTSKSYEGEGVVIYSVGSE